MANAKQRSSKPSPTHSLSEYIATSQYENLPLNVIEQVKRCILDSLGCMLGGSRLEVGRAVLSLFSELKGKAEATIIPKGLKVPTIHAAYVNSYIANLMDFDDVLLGHPGSCIVPPALAMAEMTGASGRDLINAVAQAYEVNSRITDAIYPSLERMAKVHGVGTHQVFAAVTTACVLRHLDEKTVAMALGLAGVNAPVPSSPTSRPERPLSWSKFNFGWASMGGILGALLAERGFRGNQAILDGEKGFWIMSGSDQCHFEKFTYGLGQKYYVLQLEFKPYPCCRYLHSSLDAIKEIANKHNIHPDSLEEVHVSTISLIGNRLMDYTPKNEVEAQFSLPYTTAMVLLGKPPGYEWMSPANLADPRVQQIAKKVTYEQNKEADRDFYKKNGIPSTVIIHAAGKEFTARTLFAKGHPRNPLSDLELKDKFRSLSVPVLGSSTTEKIVSKVEQLEKEDNVSSLISLLRGRNTKRK